MDLPELERAIVALSEASETPVIVGVSGYGGSGKSTLARRLVARIDGSVRLRGDDFLGPVRSHRRSADWDGVDRARLVREVLEPFRQRRPGMFRPFDWTTRALADPEPVPLGDILVIDLVGLFHPDTLPWLDLKVWCDVELAKAAQRGMRRDAEAGHDHDRLWREIWIPNDRDFDAHFAPRDVADVLYRSDGDLDR